MIWVGGPSLPPATGGQLHLAAPHALPTCLFPTNLCLCLVLNFPARCLVVNGVSFGSTPAGDRGTPLPAPPVPTPPCSTQFGGWRGGQDGPRTRCMCLPPAICLGAPMSPQPSGGCLCQVWGHGPGAHSARRDTYRSLGMSSGSAADPLCDLSQIASLLWTSVSHLWNGQIELEAL